MQALTELNQQLQEENKTAIDVMTEHKDEIKQQTKTIAKSQQEDDYDIDIEEEQSGMFDHMVSRKQKSDNVLKQKQREMMELERKMKTLQQQMTDDEKFAKDLYNKQLDEHNKRMEEERRKQELEREKYIEKHYISADKITVTKG
eukprot:739808_1